jgi:membrane protein YqaA with SNARE-associated domain
MEASALAALGGLFVAAFGAATVLPFQSEVVLVAMVAAGTAPVWLMLLVASVGNTLGSVVNWWLGRYVEHFRGRRWFPVTAAQLDRAQAWYARWGVWTLLLSWAPFGDGFTVVAGIMRTPLWLFTMVVAAVKTGRYMVVVWLTEAAAKGMGG